MAEPKVGVISVLTQLNLTPLEMIFKTSSEKFKVNWPQLGFGSPLSSGGRETRSQIHLFGKLYWCLSSSVVYQEDEEMGPLAPAEWQSNWLP